MPVVPNPVRHAMTRCLPYGLAGLGGFCVMTVELLAARIVAPYIGVSLFTWTSVIGVVLTGVALGSYAGGVWAKQQRSPLWMGRCLIWSALSILAIVYLVPLLGKWFEGSGVALWERALLFSLTCFFAPAFFLSTLTPQLMQHFLSEVSHGGTMIGRLGAANAVGSLLGTVLAGFVLIPLIGTRWILILAAALLLLSCLLVTRHQWSGKGLWALAIVFAFVGTIFVPTMCQRETNYYCIRVAKEQTSRGPWYLLRLDHLVHSYVDPDHPTHVGYGYEQLYRRLIALHHDRGDAFASLFIGGGGYTLPRYLEALYPFARITVTEIDPGVTHVNEELMGLATSTRIHTANEDARMFLRHASSTDTYDLIFGDAFNDFSVPYHLTTQEFHQEMKHHLTPGGIYALNIIDDVRYGFFLAAMMRTLRPVWRHVYLAPLGERLHAGRNTFVLIATDEPIDPLVWEGVRAPSEAGSPEEEIDPNVFHLLSDGEVDAFLSAHPAPPLRDDYVPVDRYLAPIFHDAY